MFGFIFRSVSLAIQLAILAVVLCAIGLDLWRFANVKIEETQKLVIPQGASIKSIVDEMQVGETFTTSRDQIYAYIYLRFVSLENPPQAGDYKIPSGTTVFNALQMFTQGRVTQSSITFIEGKTFKDIRRTLNHNQNIQH